MQNKMKQELSFVDQEHMAVLNKMEKELYDDNENHNKDSEYLFLQALVEAEWCMINH